MELQSGAAAGQARLDTLSLDCRVRVGHTLVVSYGLPNEELITVALENKGLAGSAAAMQLVDKLAGGQGRSSLETAESPAEALWEAGRGNGVFCESSPLHVTSMTRPSPHPAGEQLARHDRH